MPKLHTAGVRAPTAGGAEIAPGARFIEGDEPAGAETFWVVGGAYMDTDFSQTANEDGEDWVGPFETDADAKTKWAELAWLSVDDAYIRWRVERRFNLPPEPAR